MKTIYAIIIGIFTAFTAKWLGIPSFTFFWWIYIIFVNLILDIVFIFDLKNEK